METAKSIRDGSVTYLVALSFVAALGGFLFGFDTAVISGTISFVKAKFAMSVMTEGWFVSSALLGCIIGVSAAGKLSDSYGRKKVMLLSAVLFLVSGIGCAISLTQNGLIFFRLIGGIGVGVASIISPLYMSEFAPSHLRGRVVALYQLAITLGVTSAYLSNAYLLGLSTRVHFSNSLLQWLFHEEVWRGMLGMNALPAAVFFSLLFFVPESPRWLCTQGRHDASLRILTRVNGSAHATAELSAIQRTVQEESGVFSDLFKPVFRTALIVGLTLPLLSQFSGINAVIYYGPRILESAGFSLSGALGGQVTIGIINVLFTLVAVSTVDHWGRRPLLMLGVAGAVIALIIGGVFFAKQMIQGPWILVSILFYVACFSFSFGPVCWIIVGEIYPTTIRGRAMSLATLTIWVGNFFVGQLTPFLLDNLGPSGTFWLFAVLASPAFFITWLILPETKGKSLEEIESFWHQRSQMKKARG